MNLDFETYSHISINHSPQAHIAIARELAYPEGDFAKFMAGREEGFRNISDDSLLAQKAHNFYVSELRAMGFDASIAYLAGTKDVAGLNGFAHHDRTGTMARHVFRVRSYDENKGIGTELMRYELLGSQSRGELEFYCGRADVDERHPALGRIFHKLSDDPSVPANYEGCGKFLIQY